MIPKNKSEREFRNLTVQVREVETEEMIVEGYFTTFEQEYPLYSFENVDVFEVVDRNAFNNCDLSDVIMQYDHGGRVFARIKNETLRISFDSHGGKMEANLSGTEIGRELYQEIRGGYTDKMSFGFTVSSDSYTNDELENGRIKITRRILGIKKLYDVSAVSLPANDNTEISARNHLNGEIEKIVSERMQELENIRKRKMLATKIKLMEVSFDEH